MNIVFWALVGIGAVLFWLVSSSCFQRIGEIFSDLFSGAKDAMNETEIDEEDSYEE